LNLSATTSKRGSHFSPRHSRGTDAEDLNNLAIFLEASRALKEIIESAEERVVAHPPDVWLTRLVLEISSQRAAVATFNYDLLFERALGNTGAFRTLSDLYAMPLEKRWPAGSSGWISSGGPDAPVPSLHKLHGSTNWYYGGLNSPTTARVTLGDESWGWGAAAPGARPPRFEVLYDDLQPLMIPPTAQKTPFYGNISLRSQWRKTFLAMRRASELVVLGFSFPASDQQVRLLARMAEPWEMVTIVDPCEAVYQPVRSWYGAQRCRHYSSVESYVGASCGDLVEWGEEYADGGCQHPVVLKNGDVLAEFAALTGVGSPAEWEGTIGNGAHAKLADAQLTGPRLEVRDYARDREPTSRLVRMNRWFAPRLAQPEVDADARGLEPGAGV